MENLTSPEGTPDASPRDASFRARLRKLSKANPPAAAAPIASNGHLHVVVSHAVGLKAADKGGTSDPYVKVRCRCRSRCTCHRRC